MPTHPTPEKIAEELATSIIEIVNATVNLQKTMDVERGIIRRNKAEELLRVTLRQAIKAAMATSP